MNSRAVIITLAVSITAGCTLEPVETKLPRIPLGARREIRHAPPVMQVPAPHQQYFASNIDWRSVQRVALMPFANDTSPMANQTAYPRVVFEMQTNLAAELQRAGRFDVVVVDTDDAGLNSRDVFATGEFNELEVLRVARQHLVDAIIFVKVTQYQPYPPPRLGLSLLMVSPAEGMVIASVNGLWDARESNIAAHAQAYMKQTQNWPRSLFGAERVMESPDVYQRYVSQQVALALYPPAIGAGIAMGQMAPMEQMIPAEAIMPTTQPANLEWEIPPTPPADAGVE